MDKLIDDRGALQAIIAGYKAAAEYYVSSDEDTARDARSRLGQSTRGTIPFFTELAQDVGGIHLFLAQTHSPAKWDDAQRDLHSLLPRLAILLLPKHQQQQEALLLPSSGTSVIGALLKFHARIRSWTFDRLDRKQVDFLARLVDLTDPPLLLREEIARACKAAIHLQPIIPGGQQDEEDNPDAWASGKASKLCEPLRTVHDVLLRDWYCECPIQHTHVLTSFATPCVSGAENVHCVLHFPAGEQSKTVFLDVMNDSCNGTTPSSPDASDLHDQLSYFSECSLGTARLTFSPTGKRWTMRQEGTNTARRHDMVSLAELIVMDGDLAVRRVFKALYSHRVSLALMIAYAFLELGNSSWLPYTTDHINVWLPILPGPAPDLLHPYIEVGLDNTCLVIDSDYYGFLDMVNSNMPCLPVLGKLIFELISGDPILAWELGNMKTRLHRYHSQHPERAPHVSSAVLSCTHDFKQGMISTDEKLRIAFIERVVQRLHKLLEQCPERDLKTVLRKAQRVVPQSSSGNNRKNNYIHAVGKLDNQTRSSQSGHFTSTICLHDDGSAFRYDEAQAKKAKHFLDRIADVHYYIDTKGKPCRPVKVAIVDTGACFGAHVRNSYGTRLKECRSWLHPNVNFEGRTMVGGMDDDGHGTHCTSTLLKCAPENCEVYVAQVFASSKEKMPAGSPENSTRVAWAIDYAVNVWEVDIISMSFGFEAEDANIEASLKNAEKNDVLLIAAASNVGGDHVDAFCWPAATRDNVMCMYATDGKGQPYAENPRWCKEKYRFATLGVMVPGYARPDDHGISHEVHRSGTSISTPAAAGVAACVLSFVWQMEAIYIETARSETKGASERFQLAKGRLFRASGMNKVFEKMTDADGNNGFHFVHPWRLFDGNTTSTTLIENIVNCLI